MRTVGFTLAVFGLYAAAVYAPVLARRWSGIALPRPPRLLIPLAAGVALLPTIWFGAFLVAALAVRLVYQKYFDPFALLALALFARPPDFRRPLDYAGVAVLGAGFILYALLGGG